MFSYAYCRPLSVLISMKTKLSIMRCPTTPIEMDDMAYIPYDSTIGSLMYVMVCTRLDISQELGFLSQLWLILDMKIGLQ